MSISGEETRWTSQQSPEPGDESQTPAGGRLISLSNCIGGLAQINSFKEKKEIIS